MTAVIGTSAALCQWLAWSWGTQTRGVDALDPCGTMQEYAVFPSLSEKAVAAAIPLPLNPDSMTLFVQVSAVAGGVTNGVTAAAGGWPAIERKSAVKPSVMSR